MKFESIQKNEKEIKWRQTEQEIENIKDRKGRGIDEKIKSAVAALKLNGFGTTGSCEGHLDWGLPWPYIDIESRLAEKLLSDFHYNALKEKARAMLKDGTTMNEAEKQEYNALVVQQIEENEKEYQRLEKLLQEYYGNNSQDISQGTVRLAIRKGPWNQSRFQPEDMPINMKPQDIQKLWSHEDKEQKLGLYREEMDKFTKFLKDKFFEEI